MVDRTNRQRRYLEISSVITEPKTVRTESESLAQYRRPAQGIKQIAQESGLNCRFGYANG